MSDLSYLMVPQLQPVLGEEQPLIRVAVVAPIGNSDHSLLSAVTSAAQAVPNLCVSRKVFPETPS